MTRPEEKLCCLVRNNISYYAMHTNYDVLGMAELSADYLKLTDREVLSVTERQRTAVRDLAVSECFRSR